MNVLVDTSIWSEVLRRKAPSEEYSRQLADLIALGRVELIGPIRQEILSGIANPQLFRQIRDKLQAFSDLPLGVGDFELAAEFANICRARGVQGSHTDMLICSVAASRMCQIWSSDKDFLSYKKILPVRLYRG